MSGDRKLIVEWKGKVKHESNLVIAERVGKKFKHACCDLGIPGHLRWDVQVPDGTRDEKEEAGAGCGGRQWKSKPEPLEAIEIKSETPPSLLSWASYHL